MQKCSAAGAPLSFALPAWRQTRRHEVDSIVVEHRLIAFHEYEIVFRAPEIAESARPGQFVEILFGENYAPLVRRPFSLYRVDRAAGTCGIIYLARGAFTSGLARKKPGDVVSLLGPLGRPFHVCEARNLQHILVAGGLGAPPIYFLASELSRGAAARQSRGKRRDSLEALADAPVLVVNAARTESLLVGLTEFGALDVALHVLTDDGSRGVKGMATDVLRALLEQEAGRPRAIYACGPMAMLRSVGEIAIAHELPCQLSIETSMPCGIGLCQGCAIPVRSAAGPGGSYALACVDGPVFEARELVWDR
jgi:dihydroorotate dehydrogenase electron transfer subunit